ncbi:MAG: hypothetical protein EAZ91_22065 [Cytophagales bacterium]|nr:MAG: hypothetical protein EAZ91_22065 [Cytophagales bacterium]
MSAKPLLRGQWLLPMLLLIATTIQAQTGYFTPLSSGQARVATTTDPGIANARFYQVQITSLRAYLTQAPRPTQSSARGLRLELPMPNGTTETFTVRETQVLSPALAAENPTFKTYEGQGITHPNYVIRMSLTSLGFEALIWGVDGDAVYIKKTSFDAASNVHTSYFARDARKVVEAKGFGMLRCGSVSTTGKPELPGLKTGTARMANTVPSDTVVVKLGATRRTFRLAVATTGEWTRNAGGFPRVTDMAQVRTNALAVLVTTVNRLNGIFERELSSSFMLANPAVSGANNILYDDPATDPYDNTDNSTQLTVNHNTLNSRVGAANYDIGHLYGTTGGGVAAKSSLCDNASKGQGYSARGTDTGDPFVVDYVAHEIGHQFGMDHTYNQSDASGACTTREGAQAYETASGSTIMSYVGICSDRNLQRYVDPVLPPFHIASLKQAQYHLNNSAENGGAAGCGTSAGTNAIPTISAGPAYSIPRLTPFTLTATGNDADATDVPNLLYSWEQFDRAPSASGVRGVPVNTYDVDDDGVLRPLFRAYSPVASNQRTFPSLAFILNPQANATPGENQPSLTYQGIHPTGAPGAFCQDGKTCVLGERLPTVARTMNFRVSVRDRRGGNAEAATTVTVVNTPGAFRLTSFDSYSQLVGGNQQTVTWNVVDTDKAPINCANVRISLSTDGGQTFSTELLASTPNDGSEPITLPSITNNRCRIKVEAVGNIFFDISNVNFTIADPANQPPVAVAIPNQTGTMDTDFTFTVPAFSDPENQALTYTARGLPASMSINPDTRVISGKPGTSGPQTVTVIATDPGNLTVASTFLFTVAPIPMVVNLIPSATNITSTTLSVTVVASGGRAPYAYNFRLNGALAGFSSSGNVVTFNSIDPGVQTFTIVVTDATPPTNQTVTATVTITATAPGAAPVVGVQATDATASERRTTSKPAQGARVAADAGNVDEGIVQFERNSSRGRLVIDYAIEGSAIPGVDYVELPGSLTFLDGQRTVDVRIIPIVDENSSEQDETILITLIDEEGYDLDPAEGSALITILGDAPTPPVTPSTPENLTVTSFTCNLSNTTALSRVDFVLGYKNGTFVPALPPILMVGVTGNGQLGQRYSFPFDRNVNSITVQNATNRSTYFVWDIRAACGTTQPPSPTVVVPPSPTVVVPPTPASSLTINSFTCTINPSPMLSRVDFVVTPTVATLVPFNPLLIVGVTGNGQVGTRYSFPFDRNVSTLTVQDAATRSAYFTWNIRAACGMGMARMAEETTLWQVSVNGNPTRGPLEVVVAGAQGKSLELSVVDVSGRKVATRRVQPQTADHRETFDLSAQPGGLFILRATDEQHSQSVKVVKE